MNISNVGHQEWYQTYVGLRPKLQKTKLRSRGSESQVFGVASLLI